MLVTKQFMTTMIEKLNVQKCAFYVNFKKMNNHSVKD